MKKQILLFLATLFFAANTIFAQDVIYVVTGEINETKTSLDSILVENLTNGTRIMFGDLPEQDNYQINLTRNAFWGAVGTNDFNQAPAFVVAANSPGLLTLNYMESNPANIRLSVYSILGQCVYSAERRMINARNSIRVQLSQSGVYFVRVEAPDFTQTFKAIGADNNGNYTMEIAARANSRITTKSGAIITDTDFNFTPGDSIRISVYKEEYYARPIGKDIVASENINFLFEVSKTVTDSVSDAYVALNEINTDITAFDTLTGAVEITYSGDKPDLKPGDVITVDADTMGYLRKVVETTTETDGTVTVKTEQAYLNDIFVNRSFKLKTELLESGVQLKSNSSAEEISKALTDEDGYIHPVKIIYHNANGKLITKSALTKNDTDDEGRINIIDFYRDLAKDLYGEDGDNVHFYIDEGHILLKADAVFELGFEYEGELTEDTKIKKGKIKTFKFYLDSHAEFLTKLALDMNKSYDKEKTKRLVRIPEVTVKFLVGPIPLWITFYCDIYGKYHFTADASVHADWGFESKHAIKVGGLYTHATKSLSPISEYTPTNTVYPLNINGEINAMARLELYPRIDMKFYSFFGPYAEIVPYVEGNYNAAMQSQITAGGAETFLAWNSGIDLGLDFRVGTELRFLGLTKTSDPKIVNGPVWPLWKSPTQITLQTNLPTETYTETELPLKFKVTDKLNIPVPLCPVYIAGDGTFSKQILFTDINGEATVNWTVGDTESKNQFNANIYKADKTLIKIIMGEVNVVIERTAPEVTTLAATDETTNSAQLNGNVTADGNATITERGFFWSKTNTTPGAADNKVTVTGTTGVYNKTITALQENTTYYYRAYAINSQDTATGDVVTFFTPQTTVDATITTLAATNKTENSAQLNGEVGTNGNSQIVRRGFYWSKNNSNPDKNNGSKKYVTGTTGVYNLTLTGLQENTTYYYRAFFIATQMEGDGLGSVKTFTTTTAASAPTVTTTAATNITTTAAQLNGNVTADGNATITQRGFYYSKTDNTPDAGDTKVTVTGTTGTFSKTVNGLDENTTYYYRAFATNSEGTATGSVKSFTTTTAASAPTLTTTAITAIAQTTATSGGNITDNGGSSVTARGVCWSTAQNPTIANSTTNNGTGTGSFASSITGLTANTTYYVRAYATNSQGTAYGNQVQFTTQNSGVVTGTFTDSRDSKTYKTVTIGSQTWMAENLAYLPSVSPSDSGSVTEPYYYVYGYQGESVTAAKATTNYDTYGVLYNWPAAKAACPSADGWHLPTDAEWKQLEIAIGMSQSEADDTGYRGTNEGTKLKATTGWYNNGNGTDDYGFSALPGGNRGNNDSFRSVGYYGYWWSATEHLSSSAWLRTLAYDSSVVYRGSINKELGFSVRCIRD